MKKLNRKGFTLVELLAVIIILAIVVGISIPAITSIINGSKNSALGVAVDTAADYLADQYNMMNISYNTASEAFRDQFGQGQEGEVIVLEEVLYKEAGLISANVAEVLAQINSDGSVCVTVTKIVQSGEYYSTTYWNTDGTAKADAENYSRNCSEALVKPTTE